MKNTGKEVVAGLVTFATLCYIIFVQPAVLGIADMPFEGVLFATCLTSAFATFLMGILANLPIAIAPAMGHNIFFALVLCISMGLYWQEALAANFISGILFTIVTLAGLSELITRSIPNSLKASISVGIGLLISFVGLQWGGIVTKSEGTLVQLGDLKSVPAVATFIGLAIAGILYALGLRFSIILGIAASTIFLWWKGVVSFVGIFEIPTLTTETIIKFDFSGLFSRELFDLIAIIFIFFFLDLFDTAGTLIGLAEVGRFQLDRKATTRVFMSDAFGTVVGTMLGTSTVTSYVESAAGIQAGGKTRTVCFTVAALFVLSLFFLPLIRIVGGGVEVGGTKLYPTISCALVMVGLFMMQAVSKVRWDDITEALPAFLTILSMGFSLSITDGISFGFISYTVLKLLTGRIKDLNPILIIFSILFGVRYLLLEF